MSGRASGSHTLNAEQIDAAGNLSAQTTRVVTVDTTALAAPQLTQASDSGLIGDNITNITTPTLTGTATAGASVELWETFNGSTAKVATLQADVVTGVWNWTASTALAQGDHSYQVKELANGSVSRTSALAVVTVDTTLPTTVPTLKLWSGSDSGTVGDNVTNVASPMLAGKADAYAWVSVYQGGNNLVGTVQADGTGAWRLQVPTALSNGSYSFTAKQTDVAGNVGSASAALTVTVDSSAAAPTASGSSGFGLVRYVMVHAPDSLSTALGISDLKVMANGVNLASGKPSTSFIRSSLPDTWTVTWAVDSSVNTSATQGSAYWGNYMNGAWVQLDLGALYAVDSVSIAPRFNYQDQLGNAYILTSAIDMSTLNPSTSVSGSTTYTYVGLAGNLLTNSQINWGQVSGAPVNTGATVNTSTATSKTVNLAPQPVIYGTAEAGATVSISENGVVLGTALTRADGTWSWQATSITNGSHNLSVVQTDLAGNVSASGNYTFTVDTTRPSTPALLTSSDSGLAGDAVTRFTTPTWSGTSSASTVDVYDNGVKLNSAPITVTNGSWTFTPSTALAAGSHGITVTDANGKSSNVLNMTVDATAASAPTMNTLATSSRVAPVVSGTAEALATVTLTAVGADGVSKTFTVLADATGAWQVDTGMGSNPLVANQAYTFSAKQTDAAGNTSLASTTQTQTLDTKVLGFVGASYSGSTLSVQLDKSVTGTSSLMDWSVDDSSGNAFSSTTLSGSTLNLGLTSAPSGILKANYKGLFSAVSDAVGNKPFYTKLWVGTSGVDAMDASSINGVSNSANTALFGNGGDETLKGGSGNDWLQVGTGASGAASSATTMTGGLGADVFKWAQYTNGTSTVTDFSKTQGDVLNLQALLTGQTVTSANLIQYLNLSGNGTDAWLKVYTGAGTFGSDATKLTTITLTGAYSDLRGTAATDSIALQTLLEQRVILTNNSYTPDTTAPVGGSIALNADTGIAGDGITTNGKINVTNLEANVVWEYSINGGVTWTVGSGNSFMLGQGTYAIGSIIVRQTDQAGNVQTTGLPSNTQAITVDTTAPLVTAITGPTSLSTASYATTGGVFNVSVGFDSIVRLAAGKTVTLTALVGANNGTLQSVTLTATGDTNTSAGVNKLTFISAQLPGGLSDSDGVDIRLDSLNFTAGDLSDIAGNDVSKTLTLSGSVNRTVSGNTVSVINLANQNVDTATLSIASMKVSDQNLLPNDPTGAVGKSGDTVNFDLSFSEAVQISGTAPSIVVSIGGSSVTLSNGAVLAGDAKTIRFSSTALSGNSTSVRLVSVSNSSSIKTNRGSNDVVWDGSIVTVPQVAYTLDNILPVISSVTNPSSITYAKLNAGSTTQGTLSVEVNFDGTVYLSNGGKVNLIALVGSNTGSTQQVTLTATGDSSTATSGVTKLTFTTSTLPSALVDTDGVQIKASSLTLNSGTTLVDAAGNSVSTANNAFTVSNLYVDTSISSPVFPVVYDGYRVATTPGAGSGMYYIGLGISNSATMTMNVGTTVSLWVNLDTANALSSSKQQLFESTFGSVYVQSGTLYWTFNGVSTATNFTSLVNGGNNAFTDGKWHNIVVVSTPLKADGTTAGAGDTVSSVKVQLYVDGSATLTDNTVLSSYTYSSPSTATASTLFLGNASGSGSQLSGKLAQVRYWDDPLTASDVANVYATPTNPSVSVTSLRAAFTFQGTTGLINSAPGYPGGGAWDLLANSSSVGMSTTTDSTVPFAPMPSNQAASPSFSGRGEAGATVSIYNGDPDSTGVLLGTALVASNGTWTFRATSLTSSNTYHLYAKQTDVAGNVSAKSAVFDVTVNASWISMPVLDASLASNDTGTVGDNITANATPVFTGNVTQAGRSVQLFDGSNLIGTATTTTGTAWSITSSLLSQGDHSIVVKELNAGVVTSTSFALAVRIDSQVAAPSIVTLSSATKTAPIVSGTAEAGATVVLTAMGNDGIRRLFSVVADGNGAWSVDTGTTVNGLTALKAGVVYGISAQQTDVAGNISASTAVQTVNYDTSISTVSFSGPANGSTIGQSAVVAGTGEAGAAVSLYDGSVLLGTTTVNAKGYWTYNVTGLSVGAHTFSATQTDLAGNTSSKASQSVTVSSQSSGVIFSQSGFYSVRISTASGVTRYNTSLNLTNTGTDSSSSTDGATLSVWAKLDAATLSAEQELFNSATIGEVEVSGKALRIYTGSAWVNVGYTVDDQWHQYALVNFNGTGYLYVDGALKWSGAITGLTASSTTSSLGLGNHSGSTFNRSVIGSIALAKVWDAGLSASDIGLNYINASTSKDGQLRAVYNFVSDASNAVAGGSALTPTSGTGASFTFSGVLSSSNAQSDLIAGGTATTVVLSGVTTASTQVKLWKSVDGGVTWSTPYTLTSDATGAWSGAGLFTFSSGVNTIKATTVQNGVDTTIATRVLTFDAGIPTERPSLTLDAASDSGTTGDFITANAVPTLTGKAMAGAWVNVYQNGNLFGTVQTDASGTWRLSAPKALTDGSYSFYARQTDAAGNEGLAGNAITLKVDTNVGVVNGARMGVATGTARGYTTPTVTIDGGTTVSFWAKLDSSTYNSAGYQGAFSAANLGEFGFYGGHIEYLVSDASGALDWRRAYMAKFDAEWHNYTVVQTGTAAGSIIRVYQDGVQIALNSTMDFVTSQSAFTSLAFKIGNSQWNNSSLNGSMAMFKVWDVALSGADVAQVAMNRATSQDASLVVSYDLLNNIKSQVGGADLTLNDSATTGTEVGSQQSFDAILISGSSTVATRPVLNGYGEPGATIKLYDNNGAQAVGSVQVRADGTWFWQANAMTSNGSHSIVARHTDAAGNVTTSAAYNFNVDVSLLAAPMIGTASDTSKDTGVLGDGITSSTSFVLSGLVPSGASTIRVFDKGVDITSNGTVSLSGGAWTFTSTAAWSVGQHLFFVKAYDSSNQVGVASAIANVLIDNTLSALTINTPALSSLPPVLTGTAEALATVYLTATPTDGSATKIFTAVADASGAWRVDTGAGTSPLFTDKVYNLSVTQTDLAGNTSSTPTVLSNVTSDSKPLGFASASYSGTNVTLVMDESVSGSATLADFSVATTDNSLTSLSQTGNSLGLTLSTSPSAGVLKLNYSNMFGSLSDGVGYSLNYNKLWLGTGSAETTALDASLNSDNTPNTTNTAIFGNGGNDVLKAGSGNDWLQVGSGLSSEAASNTTLTGGAGHDVFKWAKYTNGTSTVTDFSKSQGDVLNLQGLLDGKTLTSLNMNQFLNLTSNGPDAVLKVDVSGAGNFVAPTLTINISYGAADLVSGTTLQQLVDQRVIW